MSLRKLYIRTLLVVAVVGPLFWLVFSQDGRRVSDVLILKVTGRPDIGIAFDKLDGGVTETDVLKVWSDADFQCGDQATAFGTRACMAPIAAFNGTPARYVTFFFVDDHLNAIKLGYQRAYHEHAVAQLRTALGEPSEVQRGARSILQWDSGGGMMVVPEARVGMEEEPALLWLAAEPSE